MKKSTIAVALSAAVALASATTGVAKSMEKCKVTVNGVGYIKSHKADCKGSSHSCSGMNKAGDPESWILVKKGECEKINHGDLSGISPKVLSRIDVEGLTKATHKTAPKKTTMPATTEVSAQSMMHK